MFSVDRVAAVALHGHGDNFSTTRSLALVSHALRVADICEKKSAISISNKYSEQEDMAAKEP